MPGADNLAKTNLLQELYDAGVYKFGEFRLKSGQFTPIYIDLRSLISKPPLFKLVVDSMWSEVNGKFDFDCICGVPQAAVPMATGLMVNYGSPMILRRKEAKGYGTKKLIEGHFTPNDTCLVIEDVTVLGWSIEETVTALREQNLVVTEAITLVDRQQGATENLEKIGVKLHCVLNLDDILAFLISKQEMVPEKAKEIKEMLADTSYMTTNGNH